MKTTKYFSFLVLIISISAANASSFNWNSWNPESFEKEIPCFYHPQGIDSACEIKRVEKCIDLFAKQDPRFLQDLTQGAESIRWAYYDIMLHTHPDKCRMESCKARHHQYSVIANACREHIENSLSEVRAIAHTKLQSE
jgi:hypothetical protein